MAGFILSELEILSVITTSSLEKNRWIEISANLTRKEDFTNMESKCRRYILWAKFSFRQKGEQKNCDKSRSQWNAILLMSFRSQKPSSLMDFHLRSDWTPRDISWLLIQGMYSPNSSEVLLLPTREVLQMLGSLFMQATRQLPPARMRNTIKLKSSIGRKFVIGCVQ